MDILEEKENEYTPRIAKVKLRLFGMGRRKS